MRRGKTITGASGETTGCVHAGSPNATANRRETVTVDGVVYEVIQQKVDTPVNVLPVSQESQAEVVTPKSARRNSIARMAALRSRFSDTLDDWQQVETLQRNRPVQQSTSVDLKVAVAGIDFGHVDNQPADGKIVHDEWAARYGADKKVTRNAASVYELYDTNGDGVVDLEEFKRGQLSKEIRRNRHGGIEEVLSCDLRRIERCPFKLARMAERYPLGPI